MNIQCVSLLFLKFSAKRALHYFLFLGWTVLTFLPFDWLWFRVIQFASVQLLSYVRLFVTPRTTACQVSLHHQLLGLLKLMSIESVMPFNHFILCCPLLFNLSQHQGLFQWVSSLHQVAKVWEFQLQHHSFQWISRTDFL